MINTLQQKCCRKKCGKYVSEIDFLSLWYFVKLITAIGGKKDFDCKRINLLNTGKGINIEGKCNITKHMIISW